MGQKSSVLLRIFTPSNQFKTPPCVQCALRTLTSLYVIKEEDGTKAFGIIVEHMLNNSQVTIDELVGLTRMSRRQMVRYVKELSDR